MDFRLDEGPYRDLLETLGNPQNYLPPTIHIAGTNGKGSTLAFLKSIFEQAGLSVHAYTSPHLIKFNERITLNGKHICDESLLDYLQLIETANDGAAITFFEYTTALAFKAIADHPADICLIETGLGGRLDCTNVIENPIATIITSIGHDHLDWLGHSLADVSFEKSGIMKQGAPCIIATQTYANEVNHVFQKRASEVKCDIHFVDRLETLPPLGLLGDHQKDNASAAVATVKVTHPQVPDDIINLGLSVAKWPARMEKLSASPKIWFDCGHNAEGALTIAHQLKQWKILKPHQAIRLIIGLAGDKNPNDFMAPLWEYCDQVICVDLTNARNPQSGFDLMGKLILPANKEVSFKPSIAKALTPFEGLTLITGSLYLYEQAIKETLPC